MKKKMKRALITMRRKLKMSVGEKEADDTPPCSFPNDLL